MNIALKRYGDFYEAFDDEAQTASRVLGITLTKRGNRPMCGFPVHAAPDWIARLEDAGHTVEIA